MAERTARGQTCPMCWAQKHECVRDLGTSQCRRCRSDVKKNAVEGSSLDPSTDQPGNSEERSGNAAHDDLAKALNNSSLCFLGDNYQSSDDCNLAIDISKSSSMNEGPTRIALHVEGPFSIGNKSLIAQLDSQVRQVLASTLRGRDEHPAIKSAILAGRSLNLPTSVSAYNEEIVENAVDMAVLAGAYMHLLFSSGYAETADKSISDGTSPPPPPFSQTGLSRQFKYLVFCRLRELLRYPLDAVRMREAPPETPPLEFLGTYASIALLRNDIEFFRKNLRNGELSKLNNSPSFVKTKLIDWLTDLQSELTAYLSLGCGRYPQWRDAVQGSMKDARRKSEVLFLTMTLDINNSTAIQYSPSTTINANALTVSGDITSTHHSSEDLWPIEDADIYQSSASDDSSDKSGSIFSDNGKSDDSQSSTGVVRISLTSEIYFLLRDDEVLRPLYPLALEHMSHRKFQKLLKDLLKEYSGSLISECQDELEKKATLFVRSRLRQLIVRLTEEMNHNGSTMSLVLQTPENENYRREYTEAYLQRASTEGHADLELPSAAEMEPSDMSDNDSDDLDGPVPEPEPFALTNRMKHFLTHSMAWAKLQERFKTIVTSRIAAKKDHNPLLHRDSVKIDVMTIDDTETEAEEDEDSDKEDQELHSPQKDNRPRILSWSKVLSQALLEVFQGTQLPVGTYRIEWTCRCGHSGSDEYVEVAPGGVSDSAKDLFESPAISQATVSDRTQNAFKAFVTFVKNTALGVGRGLGLKSITEFLPTTQSTEMTTTTSSAEQSTLPPSPKYLLFCTMGPYKRKVATLQHIDICNILSDQELFTALSQFYPPKRSKLKEYTRKIQAIHFVQFEVHPKYNLDKLRHPRTPPLKKREVEYEWDVVKSQPPVGSEYMLHLFDCPTHAGDGVKCVRRFPKKLKDRLAYCREGENMGWGIYFEEGRNWTIPLVCIALFGLAGSLIFGTVWTVVEDDIQGAWGVSSWMMAAVALLLFVIQACLA